MLWLTVAVVGDVGPDESFNMGVNGRAWFFSSPCRQRVWYWLCVCLCGIDFGTAAVFTYLNVSKRHALAAASTTEEGQVFIVCFAPMFARPMPIVVWSISACLPLALFMMYASNWACVTRNARYRAWRHSAYIDFNAVVVRHLRYVSEGWRALYAMYWRNQWCVILVRT